MQGVTGMSKRLVISPKVAKATVDDDETVDDLGISDLFTVKPVLDDWHVIH